MIDQKLVNEALQRIARDAAKPGDGELIYLGLQKVVTSIPSEGLSDGALREQTGRRRFAAELMAVMAEVMAEPIGDGSDEQRQRLASGQRPVIFQLQRPVPAGSKLRGAKRRVRDTRPGPEPE